MKFFALHKNFRLPTKGTSGAGAYDIYMPEAGIIHNDAVIMVPLGFATEIPKGYVAKIYPRSGVGAKQGLELNNTVGIIDSDYRGEWKAALKLKLLHTFKWEADERLLQYVLVPVLDSPPELVQVLDTTERGTGGFGSTG